MSHTASESLPPLTATSTRSPGSSMPNVVDRLLDLAAAQLQQVLGAEVGVVARQVDDRRPAADAGTCSSLPPGDDGAHLDRVVVGQPGVAGHQCAVADDEVRLSVRGPAGRAAAAPCGCPRSRSPAAGCAAGPSLVEPQARQDDLLAGLELLDGDRLRARAHHLAQEHPPDDEQSDDAPEPVVAEEPLGDGSCAGCNRAGESTGKRRARTPSQTRRISTRCSSCVPLRRPSRNTSSTTITPPIVAAMTSLLLLVDLALDLALQAAEPRSRSSRVTFSAGSRSRAWPSDRSSQSCSGRFKMSRPIRLITITSSATDHEHDQVRDPRQRARAPLVPLGLDQAEQPEQHDDRPEPEQERPGRAEPQPLPGALERIDGLLLGVRLDQVDDVADGDCRRVERPRPRRDPVDRSSSRAPYLSRRRSRPIGRLRSGGTAAWPRRRRAPPEIIEPLRRRDAPQQAVPVGRTDRRQAGEVVRRQQRVVADLRARRHLGAASPGAHGQFEHAAHPVAQRVDALAQAVVVGILGRASPRRRRSGTGRRAATR